MKLRYLIVAAIAAFLIGGAIWIYDNADEEMATGAGGLPLIKADTDPIKLPPDEPGGEVMPHADSTVFAAISSDEQQDPSMQGVQLPSEGEDPTILTSDFAGLKTGFAVSSQPETKTESLFSTEEKQQAIETTTTQSKYVSGIAPEAVTEPVQGPIVEAKVEPAAEPDPAPVEAPKEEPEPVEKKTEAVAVAPVEEPVAPVSTEGPADTAQALEAQEKAMIRPASKPQPPVAKVEAPKEEPKIVEKKPEVKSEPVANTPIREVDVAARPSVGMAPVMENAAPVQMTSSSGQYVIQLSSTPSQADAERSWLRMQSLYPEALRGLTPSYKSAEVPGKGTFIRLRAGTLSREEANARCDAIRAVGARGGCLVLRN